MPNPWSRIRSSNFLPRVRGRYVNRPGLVRVLGRVGEQIGDDLGKTVLIRQHDQAAVGDVNHQGVLVLLDERGGRLD